MSRGAHDRAGADGSIAGLGRAHLGRHSPAHDDAPQFLEDSPRIAIVIGKAIADSALQHQLHEKLFGVIEIFDSWIDIHTGRVPWSGTSAIHYAT